MKTIAVMLGLLASSPPVGCTPRTKVAAPREPITTNMNIKVEREIHIKVGKNTESLLRSRSDLF